MNDEEKIEQLITLLNDWGIEVDNRTEGRVDTRPISVQVGSQIGGEEAVTVNEVWALLLEAVGVDSNSVAVNS